MKRRFTLFLALLLALALCGCGGVDNTIHDLTDVPDSVIGALRGTSSAEIASRYCRDVRLYDSESAMCNDLRAGTLDCALTNSVQTKSVKAGQSGVSVYDDLVDEGLCFITAPENADLRDKLSEAIAALNDEKVIRSIVKGYTDGEGRTYVSAGAPEDAAVLTLGVRTDYYPYSYVDGEGNITGIDVDVATAICDYLGVRLEIVPLPRGTITEMVRRGDVLFGAGGYWDGDGTETLVDHTAPYAEIREELLVRG